MAKLSLFERRRRRVRTALRKRAGDKPRLSVHRTGKHIYAQVINDADGKTIAAASTLGGSIDIRAGRLAAKRRSCGKRAAIRVIDHLRIDVLAGAMH